LLHWAPARTSGDLIAYFPAQKVMFGDLIVTDFPLAATQIHPELHGSVAGWIESVKEMLALNADTYVSGHGDLFTKNDVRTKLALIKDKWDKMTVMVAQGKSLAEIKTALG
jgi:cyclase